MGRRSGTHRVLAGNDWTSEQVASFMFPADAQVVCVDEAAAGESATLFTFLVVYPMREVRSRSWPFIYARDFVVGVLDSLAVRWLQWRGRW